MTQNSIRLATLQKGDFSGIHEPLEVVVRTQEEWEKLWKRHAAIANPPPPVDFATEMVAGVFLGDKNTGGYDVEITRAERQGSSLYIYYIEKAPGAEAMVIQVVTQPHHLVRLPRDGASVIFRRESK